MSQRVKRVLGRRLVNVLRATESYACTTDARIVARRAVCVLWREFMAAFAVSSSFKAQSRWMRQQQFCLFATTGP
jgi:hypothetical protein